MRLLRIKPLYLTVLMFIFMAGLLLLSHKVSAAAADAGTLNLPQAGKPCTKADITNSGQFLGILPVWWEYIKNFKWDTLGQCVPNLAFPGSIYPIGLAVIDILLRIAGFVAVVAIIWSGVEFVFAQGNAEKAGEAQRKIYTSLIGLGIAFVAVLTVTFLGNVLTKP